MEELVARIAEKIGVDSNTATTSVGVILKFLQDECPPGMAERVFEYIPGAAEMVSEAPQGGTSFGSMLGGLLGSSTGGMIAAVTSLTNAGLGMSQIQEAVKEVIAFAEEKAGPELVQEVLGAIPQLKMFAR